MISEDCLIATRETKESGGASFNCFGKTGLLIPTIVALRSELISDLFGVSFVKFVERPTLSQESPNIHFPIPQLEGRKLIGSGSGDLLISDNDTTLDHIGDVDISLFEKLPEEKRIAGDLDLLVGFLFVCSFHVEDAQSQTGFIGIVALVIGR